MKFTYMEETVTTLDQVVTEQALEIGALRTRIAQLEKRLTEFAEAQEGELPSSERPPHY